jgi:dihydrofolate reductase
MRKVIAAINMTLDGCCDHDAIIPDEEIHRHYADMIRSADVMLYGRITYQLMAYWRDVVENPTGNIAIDEFAHIMDKTPKIVFSHTLKSLDWESARLATQTLEQEVRALRQQSGDNVLVGSRSLIIQLMKLGLVDEFQLCIHPVIAGNGLPLFENLNERTILKLTKTKIFSSGAVVMYYRIN